MNVFNDPRGLRTRITVGGTTFTMDRNTSFSATFTPDRHWHVLFRQGAQKRGRCCVCRKHGSVKLVMSLASWLCRECLNKEDNLKAYLREVGRLMSAKESI